MQRKAPSPEPPDPYRPPAPGTADAYRRLDKHRQALRAVVREMERLGVKGDGGTSGADV